jgi:hypothetical protein
MSDHSPVKVRCTCLGYLCYNLTGCASPRLSRVVVATRQDYTLSAGIVQLARFRPGGARFWDVALPKEDAMKPGYWIGSMALVGAILGYAVFSLTGWLDAGVGTVVGIVVGLLGYTALKGKLTSGK